MKEKVWVIFIYLFHEKGNLTQELFLDLKKVHWALKIGVSKQCKQTGKVIEREEREALFIVIYERGEKHSRPLAFVVGKKKVVLLFFVLKEFMIYFILFYLFIRGKGQDPQELH